MRRRHNILFCIDFRFIVQTVMIFAIVATMVSVGSVRANSAPCHSMNGQAMNGQTINEQEAHSMPVAQAGDDNNSKHCTMSAMHCSMAYSFIITSPPSSDISRVNMRDKLPLAHFSQLLGTLQHIDLPPPRA